MPVVAGSEGSCLVEDLPLSLELTRPGQYLVAK
jgi:hypothetical protein